MPQSPHSPQPDTASRSGGWQLRAVLTDVQFWAPVLVLLAGVVLLVLLQA